MKTGKFCLPDNRNSTKYVSKYNSYMYTGTKDYSTTTVRCGRPTGITVATYTFHTCWIPPGDERGGAEIYFSRRAEQ